MAPKVWMHKPGIPGLLVVRIVEKHRLSTSASREALLTRVLLAMAPKVRKHEPDMPGVLFFRIVEKLSLSTGASREAPVDKCAPCQLPHPRQEISFFSTQLENQKFKFFEFLTLEPSKFQFHVFDKPTP